MSEVRRVLVLAPNWLGDAVMALPSIADLRRTFATARLTVAARRTVADLFRLVPGVDDVIAMAWDGRWWKVHTFVADARRIAADRHDLAILLPNSFAAAWLARRASIPERWGYDTDMRAALLTRSVARPIGSRHQGAYYQHLTRSLGIPSGPLEPVVTAPPAAVLAARDQLARLGWDGVRPLVVFAPGAAYGTAKRWMPEYVARVLNDLVGRKEATCVLVGTGADRPTVGTIVAMVDRDATRHVVDLAGQTAIDVLAGVLSVANACVANDSGAMHMAAALGTPVVAIFGPTREYETAPLTRTGKTAEVLTHAVSCRPCMLRDCPIDHRCMTGVAPERVYASVASLLSSAS
jgi:heptosyltransferase-2